MTIISHLCTLFHSRISFSNWAGNKRMCGWNTKFSYCSFILWHLQHPYSLIHKIYTCSNVLFFQFDVLIMELVCSMLVVFGTGDTVNTASRMESNSEVLKIHCSEAAAKLVMVQDPSLLLIPRDTIPVKGKRKMNTFWVYESNSWVIPQGDTTEIAVDIEIQPKRTPSVVRSISLG